jgi:hypothetical protein
MAEREERWQDGRVRESADGLKGRGRPKGPDTPPKDAEARRAPEDRPDGLFRNQGRYRDPED